MTRVLLAGVLLAAFPLGVQADPAVVRLSVEPMPAPKPALKYLLLPEVRELNPGNPVQWYLRSFQEQQNFFFGKEAVAERARYRTMPLAKLPAANLRSYGRSALRQADWAARLDTPDWEVLQRLPAGKDLDQGELKPLRVLGEALQVRFRAAAAGRRYADAAATARTLFALARHLGVCPTLPANRLGLEIAELACDTLEEMLQQPRCPNLYWALTDLPLPLVDLRKGLQADRVQTAAHFRDLRDEPMSDAEMEGVVARLSGAIGIVREQAGLPPRNLRAALRSAARSADQVRLAADRLVEAGNLKMLVAKFPPLQVVVLDARRACAARRDEDMKLLSLAPWQIDKLRASKKGRFDGGLLAELLPDGIGARRAQARLEQRLALLRHVEALRLYAAAHAGKLPAQLEDCDVPLPDDPFTGKAFRYELAGGVGRLSGGPLDDAKRPDGSVQYQVTLRK